MKKLCPIPYLLVIGLILISIVSCSSPDDQGRTLITGSGSTFIDPLMSAWSARYYEQYGVRINYQATGSGAGIRQAHEGIVDFAASDLPLEPGTLEDYGLIQFPIASGGIVPVMNVDGIDSSQLILDGPTLGDIFTGDIKAWNDPKIAALNPTIDLPDSQIVVVYRSDGSGTTYNFAEYLAKINENFRDRIGVGTSVSWPTGIGARGSAGVAAAVARVPGSIGYVEFAYVESNHLTWIQMINHDGNAVSPSLESFQEAAAQANWQAADSYYLFITDEPGANVWPIAANTFILLPRANFATAQIDQQLKFFDWAFQKDGEAIAYSLDFVPLPQPVIESIKQDWEQLLETSSRQHPTMP